MSNPDVPELQAKPPSDLTIKVEGSRHLFYRRFTQADLRSIEAIIVDGPFDRINWTITDHQ